MVARGSHTSTGPSGVADRGRRSRCWKGASDSTVQSDPISAAISHLSIGWLAPLFKSTNLHLYCANLDILSLLWCTETRLCIYTKSFRTKRNNLLQRSRGASPGESR